jgi:hypothetical protein
MIGILVPPFIGIIEENDVDALAIDLDALTTVVDGHTTDLADLDTAVDVLVARVANPAPVHGTTADPTKNDNVWGTIDEMSIVVSPIGTQLDATFEGAFDLAPAIGDTTEAEIRLAVDGVAVPNSTRTIRVQAPTVAALVAGANTVNLSLGMYRLTGLVDATPVTITAQWRAITGTTTARGTQRSIKVAYA